MAHHFPSPPSLSCPCSLSSFLWSKWKCSFMVTVAYCRKHIERLGTRGSRNGRTRAWEGLGGAVGRQSCKLGHSLTWLLPSIWQARGLLPTLGLTIGFPKLWGNPIHPFAVAGSPEFDQSKKQRRVRSCDWQFLFHWTSPRSETSIEWFISWQASWWYIICLGLVSFAKNHNFSDELWKLLAKVVSFCVQGQPRLKIRIWDHSQTCFDIMNPKAFSELVNKFLLKITFFKISTIASVCVQF